MQNQSVKINRTDEDTQCFRSIAASSSFLFDSKNLVLSYSLVSFRLETLKEEEWDGDVTVVSCDMREWDAPEQVRIWSITTRLQKRGISRGALDEVRGSFSFSSRASRFALAPQNTLERSGCPKSAGRVGYS